MNKIPKHINPHIVYSIILFAVISFFSWLGKGKWMTFFDGQDTTLIVYGVLIALGFVFLIVSIGYIFRRRKVIKQSKSVLYGETSIKKKAASFQKTLYLSAQLSPLLFIAWKYFGNDGVLDERSWFIIYWSFAAFVVIGLLWLLLIYNKKLQNMVIISSKGMIHKTTLYYWGKNCILRDYVQEKEQHLHTRRVLIGIKQQVLQLKEKV